MASGFVWRFCTAAFWTLFFVRVVIDVELAPLQLILLGTAKELTILTVEIPTGVLADLRSRRLSVIIAFLVCGAAIGLAGIADSFRVLACSQILWAFGSTFRSGAETAWYTDEVGSLRTVDAVLPRRARHESAGSIVGVVIGAIAASRLGLSTSIVSAGSLLVAWAAVLSRTMPETGFRPARMSAVARARGIVADGLKASRRPALRVLLAVTIMTGFASEAVDRLQVARLDQIGFPERIDAALIVGGAMVVQSVGAILVLAFFGRHVSGRQFIDAAIVLHAITAVGVAVLAGAGALGVALAGAIATGASREVARMVTVGWANHFTDTTNRATVHSFVGQAMSFGEISGGVLLGLLAQSAGLAAALGASASIYLISSAVARQAKSRWDRPEPPARG